MTSKSLTKKGEVMIETDNVLIQWGNVGRTEALEKYILQKSKKILKQSTEATNLIYTLSIENPINSAGVPEQKVDVELRFPKNQDLFVSKKGQDIYKTILEVQHALLTQVKSRKSHRMSKRHEEGNLALALQDEN